jgi:hypothetical protein
MQLVKTPLPTLLRARFATVLDHLPSVPSVVLPLKAWPKSAGLFLHFGLYNVKTNVCGVLDLLAAWKNAGDGFFLNLTIHKNLGDR